MALNAELMADVIIGHMPALAEADANAARRASIVAICQGVVEHLMSAAVVNVLPTALLAPPGTAGGPVTGTATGTIT